VGCAGGWCVVRCGVGRLGRRRPRGAGAARVRRQCRRDACAPSGRLRSQRTPALPARRLRSQRTPLPSWSHSAAAEILPANALRAFLGHSLPDLTGFQSRRYNLAPARKLLWLWRLLSRILPRIRVSSPRYSPFSATGARTRLPMQPVLPIRYTPPISTSFESCAAEGSILP